MPFIQHQSALRRALCAFTVAVLLIAGGTVPSSALDLTEALRRALAADPRLAAGQFEIEAARGGTLQAGKRPNPELSVELEDFLGSGDYRGFDQAKLTISLAQKFERGEKRAARIAVARGKVDVANAKISVLMREIIAQTKTDYIHVLGAQQRLELLVRSSKRFGDLIPLLRQRVEAGASPQADVSRGELIAGKSRVAVEKARAELIGAKRQLAANWSGALSDVAFVAGRLRHNGHRPVSISMLLSNLDDHPAVRAWAAVLAQRQGELRLQGATASPDLTAGIGVSRIFETDDTAVRLSGSVPLTLHDRNEGGIAEAQRRLAKVNSDREATRAQIRRRIIDAFGEFDAACVEAHQLLENVLPIARRAAEGVQDSFNQGRLGVKDLLDAHRDQYDADVQQLDADIRCHAAAAKVEALAARSPFQHGWEAVTRRR